MFLHYGRNELGIRERYGELGMGMRLDFIIYRQLSGPRGLIYNVYM